MPQRCKWTRSTKTVLDAAREVIEAYSEHWPLTLRSIFYLLVSHDVFPNNRKSYSKLGRILSSARLEGIVPWAALEDRSRRMVSWAQWADAADFTQGQLRDFLGGYSRDCLQTQEQRFEIWVEKDTVSGTISSVAATYGIPVVVARGYSSIDYIHQLRNRIEGDERPTVLLWLSDHDPSGLGMSSALLTTLHDEMGVPRPRANLLRVALTEEQIDCYGLEDLGVLKNDARSKGYKGRVVELDALDPEQLQGVLTEAIENVVDLDLREEQRHIEEREELDIAERRERIFRLIGGRS